MYGMGYIMCSVYNVYMICLDVVVTIVVVLVVLIVVIMIILGVVIFMVKTSCM